MTRWSRARRWPRRVAAIGVEADAVARLVARVVVAREPGRRAEGCDATSTPSSSSSQPIVAPAAVRRGFGRRRTRRRRRSSAPASIARGADPELAVAPGGSGRRGAVDAHARPASPHEVEAEPGQPLRGASRAAVGGAVEPVACDLVSRSARSGSTCSRVAVAAGGRGRRAAVDLGAGCEPVTWLRAASRQGPIGLPLHRLPAGTVSPRMHERAGPDGGVRPDARGREGSRRAGRASRPARG